MARDEKVSDVMAGADRAPLACRTQLPGHDADTYDAMEQHKARVLVVDDDPAVRSLLARELGAAWVVIEASDYAKAAKVIEKNPDLHAVVSDRHLGEGPDGLALLELARDLAPDALRVLVTGDEVDRALDDAIGREVVYWLIQKPWRLGEVARVVGTRAPRLR